MSASWPGRSASPAPSLSIRPRSSCVRRARRPGAPPSTQCRTGRRARRPRCWRRSAGGASPGATAPRARSTPASPPCGCAWRTGRSTPRSTRLPGEELWLIGEWRDSGETEVLPQQPAEADLAAAAGRHRQGALVLRAGPSATQAGTRAWRLRRPVLDRPASARADDLHRLCLSATPAPEGCGSGEKSWPATGRRRSRRCLRSAAPSSPSCSLRLRFLIVARTATGEFLNTLPKCQSSAK